MRSTGKEAFLAYRVENLPSGERELVECYLRRSPLQQSAQDRACRKVAAAVIALKNHLIRHPVGLAALRGQIRRRGVKMFVDAPPAADMAKIRNWASRGSGAEEIKRVLTRAHVNRNFVWKVTGYFPDAVTKSLREDVRRSAAPLVPELIRRGLPYLLLREGDIHPAESIGLLALSAFERIISIGPHRRGFEFLPYLVISSLHREDVENSLGLRIPSTSVKPMRALIEAERSAEPMIPPQCSEVVSTALLRAWDAINGAEPFMPSREPPGLDSGRSTSPVENACNNEINAALGEIITTMRPRNREMILRRYGLAGHRRMTLSAIASEFRLTRERVRQIVLGQLYRHCHGPKGARLRALLGIR